MIEFLIALLVIGLFVGPKLVKLLPRQTAPTTATAPQAGEAAPSPPAPISKWVKWLAGGIAAILVLTLLWWAWPTTSVPTPSVTDQSSIGKFLSELDLSIIPFGQMVTELVGATWAPVVILIAAAVLIAIMVWLIRKGGKMVMVTAAIVAVAFAMYYGAEAIYMNTRTSQPIPIDLRRVPLGETVEENILSSSTLAIQVSSSSRAVYGVTYTWTCPVSDELKFVFQQGKGTTLHHFTVSEESQRLLGKPKWIKVYFKIMLSPTNPCGYLEEL